ncbi:MAG: hypothetical protein Q9198_007913 [Flavoplaca austrocitrina]
MVQREAVRIGVQFQVGGKWCSFVAVKDNDKVKDGRSLDVDGDIDVLTPASEDEYAKVDAEVDQEEDGSDEAMGFGLFDDSPAQATGLSMLAGSGRGGGPAVSFSRTGGGRRSKAMGYDAVGGYSGSDEDMGFGAFDESASTAKSGGDSGYDPTFCLDTSSPSYSPASPVRTTAYGFASTRGPPTRGAISPPQFKYADMAKMVLTSDKRFTTHRSGGTHHFSIGTRDRDTDAPASKPHASTPNEKVHSVISLQDFEGWWSQSEQLYSTMGVSMTPNTKRDDKWVTVLVLKWLNVKMVAEKDVWELVAEKAKSWLEGSGLGMGELKRVEEEVVGYLE